MAFIDTTADDDATGAVADIYDRERKRRGYVPDYARVFASHPAVFDAWCDLIVAIGGTLDHRRYELVTLAAAGRLRSSYCSLAHGTVLRDRWFDPDDLTVIATDRSAADVDEDTLDATDRALMDLAERVVADATAITRADIDQLRDLGIPEGEIAGAVMAAAARCFFSKVLDALGAEPDPVYHDLEPALRDALTVGRPIAPAT